MVISTQQETKTFKDPQGDRIRQAVLSHERYLSQFPQAQEVYQGFYAGFEPLGVEGVAFLAGAEGIVGIELDLRRREEGLGFFSRQGQCIATVEESAALRINSLLEDGWIIHCHLAYSTYQLQEKSYQGVFACFCYAPVIANEYVVALEIFRKNIVNRIAHAENPGLALTQEHFAHVLDSRGAWYLTKAEPWPQLPSETLFYRRRRTWADWLVGHAIKGNKGCLVGAWVFLITVVATMVWLVCHFVLSVI